MLIKFDTDFAEIISCFVFVVFAEADASTSCLIAFAIVSDLLLFVPVSVPSLIVFAKGSDLLLFVPLPALLFVPLPALPNVVGDAVGAVVGTFSLVGVGVTGARVGESVSAIGAGVGAFDGEEVVATGQNAWLASV